MIRQRACNDELLLLESLDYNLRPRFIVIYGLQMKRFQELHEAEEEWLRCFRHDQSCRFPINKENDNGD
jgi:hypothetical protein